MNNNDKPHITWFKSILKTFVPPLELEIDHHESFFNKFILTPELKQMDTNTAILARICDMYNFLLKHYLSMEAELDDNTKYRAQDIISLYRSFIMYNKGVFKINTQVVDRDATLKRYRNHYLNFLRVTENEDGRDEQR